MAPHSVRTLSLSFANRFILPAASAVVRVRQGAVRRIADKPSLPDFLVQRAIKTRWQKASSYLDTPVDQREQLPLHVSSSARKSVFGSTGSLLLYSALMAGGHYLYAGDVAPAVGETMLIGSSLLATAMFAEMVFQTVEDAFILHGLYDRLLSEDSDQRQTAAQAFRDLGVRFVDMALDKLQDQLDHPRAVDALVALTVPGCSMLQEERIRDMLEEHPRQEHVSQALVEILQVDPKSVEQSARWVAAKVLGGGSYESSVETLEQVIGTQISGLGFSPEFIASTYRWLISLSVSDLLGEIGPVIQYAKQGVAMRSQLPPYLKGED